MAGSALLYWPALTALFQLAFADERYSHVLLVLPVSLCLIVSARLSTLQLGGSWRSGCGLLLCAGGIAAASAILSADLRLSLAVLSLVTFWIGSFILCFGSRAFATLRFPLLFLFLIVPLPSFMVERIVYFLQSGSTGVAYSLFRLFGIPVVQSGFVLSLPGLTVEIAEQCSGIRSSGVLLITSLSLAHVYLKSPWRQAMVGACVLPLAIFKNGLRVFVLSTLAVRVDPTWLEGRFHRHGGILFFAMAVVGMSALIAWLHHRERQAR